MFAQLYVSIAGVLGDPNEDVWVKGFTVLVLLAGVGIAWLLARMLWRMGRAGVAWLVEYRAWRKLADEQEWRMPGTRRLSGNFEGCPWRMWAHVADAFVQVIDEGHEPRTHHAQWEMRELDWPGRIQLLPRAKDVQLRREVEAAAARSAAGDRGGADAGQAIAAVAGLMLGQGLLSAAADLMSGAADDVKAVALMEAVPGGSSDFQSQYVLRSDHPALALRLITPEVESLIRQLQDSASPDDPADALSMDYSMGKLVLRQFGHFSRAARAEPFCRLGLALAAAGVEATGRA